MEVFIRNARPHKCTSGELEMLRNATEELKRRIVEGTITKLEMFFQSRFRGFVKKQIDNKINTDGEPFVLTNNRRIHLSLIHI